LGTVCVGCGRRAEQPPNIVLVTIEATSAANLFTYGYPRRVEPNLNDLSHHAVVFERFYAGGDITPISLTTIATGMPASRHCVTNFEGALAPEIPTLAELLNRAGYRTFFAGEAAETLRGLGLARGVETMVVENHWGDFTVPAYKLNEAVLRFIKEDDRRPFFAWLHYYETHGPYNPLNYHGAKFRSDQFYRADDREVPAGALRKYNFDDWFLYRLDPAKKLRDYVAAHDGQIFYVDEMIGGFMNELKSLGIFDRTALLVTTDHGEMMGEKGHYFMHGTGPYESLIHIPFFLKPPGGPMPERRIKAVAGHQDIAPTVLRYAGLPAPAAMEGRALQDLLTADHADRDRRLTALSATGQLAVFDGELKVVGAAGQAMLPVGYQIPERGAEAEADVDAPEFEGLRETYRAQSALVEACRRATAPRAMSDEERRRLESLGYIQKTE